MVANAYVTNLVSSSASVINLQTNKVVETINVGGTRGFSPSGIDVTPDGSKVYISVTNNTVVVYSTKLKRIVKTIAVGRNPRRLVVIPNGNRVYVANAGSNTVSVINTHTNQVMHTIRVGRDPRGIAVSPNGKFVYVANYHGNSILVIRTSTKKVITRIRVGRNPLGIAFTPDSQYAYVTNHRGQTVSVIDVNRHKQIRKISGVGGFPFDVVVSPDGKNVYVSSDGGIARIDPVTNRVVQPFGSGVDYAQGLAAYGHRVYAVTDSISGVVILTPRLRRITNIVVGSEPELIVIGN